MKSLRYSEKLRIAADHNFKERDYWLNNLQGELPRSNFPYDKKSIEDFGTQYHMDEIEFKLPAALQEGLIQLCNHSDEALHVILLAGLALLLHKYTDNNDILLATPIYREDGDGEFINTVLIIRSRITVDITFKELLLQVKQQVTAANENANYPIEILVEQLGMKSSIEDEFPPDIVMLLDNIHDKSCIHHIEAHTVFYFSRTPRCIEGVLEYNILLYNKGTLERILVHFIKGLQQAVSDVNIKVSHINILSLQERKQLLFDFNHTAVKYPEGKTLHQLLEERVEKVPDSLALKYADTQLTYRELNVRANRLARTIRAQGISPGNIIALAVERSIEVVIGILGVLKSGAGYLTIDPRYPISRIEYMLDNHVRLTITTKDFPVKIGGKYGSIDIADHVTSGECTNNFERVSGPADLFYVIYTSGSTGQPKGVGVTHRNFCNLVHWFVKEFFIDHRDHTLLVTSLSFDLTQKNIFAPLISGGKLFLYPSQYFQPDMVLREICRERISLLNCTPSMFYKLMEGGEEELKQLSSLRYLFLGGEPISLLTLAKWVESGYFNAEIVNTYGPTECTDICAFYRLADPGDTAKAVPIGKPIYNVKLYVLDRHLNLLPIGLPGELFISGAGVGEGYVNDSRLTAVKYIKIPHIDPRKRFYRTGDLVKWLPDGNIEFLGRLDNQVKIRGFRIEPGEIESILMEHEEIKEALVKTGEDEQGDLYLCAYFVSRQHFSIDILREYLANKLPDYMIPAYFIRLDKIPLSPNGKIDRKALPVPNQEHLNRDREYVRPGSPVEEALVNTWQQVFGRSPVGITENFFMIGGDSIKAIQISSRLNKMGLQLEVEHILQYPTILQSAPRVKKVERMASQLLITGEVLLTPIQVWFLDFHHIAPHHYNQAVMLYSKEGLNQEAIRAVFLKIYEHHDALRMTFQQKDGAFIQVNMGLDHRPVLQAFDLRNLPLAQAAAELEARTNEIPGSIDLENGPLMKLALFHLADGDRLLIVIHHLVMDGISWRILFEDIDTLYRQYREGGQLVLPPKTDSFKRWSERLAEYSNSNELLKEKDYWAKWETLPIPVIETDYAEKENYFKDSRGLSFELNEESTAHLLKGVNQAFGTEIKDILLTALGLSIKKSFGCHRLLLSLENHGREKIIKDIDISKTVGWFTTVYPLVLDIDYEDDLARQIKEVKELLHQVPNNGIGYGILKYLTRAENKKDMHFQLRPQIIFNYLGQFSMDIKNMSFFSIAKESLGNLSSPDEKRYYDLSINALIRSGSLRVSINFSRKQYKPGTIKKFLNNYQEQLNRVISFCAGRQKRELTPSDLTYKEMSLETVAQLSQQYEIEDIYPLSPMQEGMLFHTIYDQHSPTYFEQLSYRLRGKLDISLVEKSINELFKRYDILRTVFLFEGVKRPVQIVLKERRVEFLYRDLREMAGSIEETFIKNFKKEDRRRGFDLSKDVLMRISVIQVDKNEYEFIWSFHHILMDGWCIGILNAEFYQVYSSLLEGKSYQLPVVKPYRTFIRWLEDQDKESSKEYWLKRLGSYTEVVGIPKAITGSHPREGYKNEEVRLILEQDKSRLLKELAAKNHVTLNTFLQAVWAILVGKYNRKQDVVFGGVVAGRPSQLEGVETMVGLFINTIPVRICYEEKTTFRDLVAKVQEHAIADEPHHYYPLSRIQSESVLKNDLLDHIFVYESYPMAEQIDGINAKSQGNRKGMTLELSHVKPFEQTNYDFNVIVSPRHPITIKFQYNGNVYDKDFVRRIAIHLNHLLHQILNNTGLCIEELILLTGEERKQLLNDFNNTASDYPRNKTIHQLFEEQVKKTPDHTALVGQIPDPRSQIPNQEGTRGLAPLYITYRELKEKSDRLAILLMERGIGPDIIGGIMVERSVEMVIGIFGILKSGGTYLPVDPDYPQERIDYMLKDSGAKLLVTTNDKESEKVGRWEGEKVFLEFINHHSNQLSSHHSSFLIHHSNHLLYVIYTSGTTGKPKGAGVYHSGFSNLLHWFVTAFGLNAEDRNLLLTSLSFDLTQKNIFAPLVTGGALTLPGLDYFDPAGILRNVEEKRLTWFNCTPGMIYKIIEYSNAEELRQLSSLRYVFLGGEPLSLKGIREWVDSRYFNAQIVNTYGPTECTDICASYSINEPGRFIEENVPTGKPVYNVNLYVLDRWFQLLPVGVMGELLIGGAGVGLGYLNHPELTAEKFIISHSSIAISSSSNLSTNDQCPMSNDFFPNDRLYFTGDLARWLPDGNIEFLGRMDDQVKIRGFRIELGEIESELLSNNDIKEAFVAAKEEENGNIYLCAYIVPGKEFTVSRLRSYLSKSLPDYMLPSYFIPLEKMPLTANGKVDRKNLPDPGLMDLRSDLTYIAPRNIIEKELTEIWQKVLGIDTISIDDNFFEIGGDSIKTIQVVSRMKKVGYKLEVEHIFRNPRISELALFVKNVERIPDQSVITGTVPLTPIQEWFFGGIMTGKHHSNQAVMLYFEGGIEEEIVRSVFLKLQEHHDTLRMIYKKSDETIIQVNQGLEHPFSLQVFNYRNREDAGNLIESKANEIQASINLETGPLMKLGIFHLDDGDRLLIVIHHLVIDGVSWRILFEDIETLYRQYKKGKPLTLPLKTDSFKLWAEKLYDYANSDKFLKEKAFWAELESKQVQEIKKDFEEEDNYMKDVASLSFYLEETETHLLLTKVNAAFGTEVNDILLTGLGLGCKGVFGNRRILVALESHGREEILEDIDINRTVGWFTSVYPVILNIDYEDDPARQIKEVKEHLHQVPNKGRGYGILKYITKVKNKKNIDFILRPKIIFNFLGQFGTDIEHMSFKIAGESTGNSVSPGVRSEYELNVSGIITDKRLKISVSYSGKQYKSQTIERLINNFHHQLTRIISFCSPRPTRELTPSDFTYKALSIETVDRLSQQYPLEDIYPLSPMQEGILFYVLYNKGTTAYIEQMSYRIHGNLNISIVEKCLNDLSNRYEILRTAFVYKNLERPLQLVLRERKIDFYYEDIREKIAAGDQESFIKNFKTKDRQRSFDFAKGALMRMSVLRTDREEYHLTWSFHHILMDGWCLGIIMADFNEIYKHYLLDRKLQLPPVKKYRSYIQWLENQDKEKSLQYWRKYLHHYSKPAELPKKSENTGAGQEYINGRITAVLESEVTHRLKKWAGKNKVTLNTLVQAAWGILLARYNNRRDVVFGAVVSGRPPQVEGVEAMIGLFINTIPVRLRYDDRREFHSLLKQLQEEAIETGNHHYCSLAEIQSQSPLKQNLLDHILVSENYPTADRIDGLVTASEKNPQARKFRISNMETFEHSNYDLMVSVFYGDTLKIRFDYNANIYDKATLENILEHYTGILNQLSENPFIKLKDISIEHRILSVESTILLDEESDFGF